jgi:hypothetical protein
VNDAKTLPKNPSTVNHSSCTSTSLIPPPVSPIQQLENKAQPLPHNPAIRKPIPVPEPQTSYRPYQISAFWTSINSSNLSLACREHNVTDINLFTFDVVHSLNQRDRDFLIHARLAHLPSNKIVQLIKNGSSGLPFSGKLLDLCRPCMESHQRSSSHGKYANRHPNGRIGEHLH